MRSSSWFVAASLFLFACSDPVIRETGFDPNAGGGLDGNQVVQLAAAQTPRVADEMIVAERCSTNQHVSNHACIACDAGTTRAAGDAVTGDGTSCTATLCAANEHVSSNTCISCGAGGTRPAGDDASGADTDCSLLHRYFRFVIDSVHADTDGFSSVNELTLQIGGVWQTNPDQNIGDSLTGAIDVGLGAGNAPIVTVTSNCCGRDLGWLFNGDTDQVAWVAVGPLDGWGYAHLFDTIGNGDSGSSDAVYATLAFPTAVQITGLRVYGDPWANGGDCGAEAPDRYRFQYSDDGTTYADLYQTPTDVDSAPGCAGYAEATW